MAGISEVSVAGVLEKISQGHLECPICFSRFTNPKILNCLHSFCQRCLEIMMEGHPQQGEITCPICRQKMALSDAGIAGILNNFSLMALVDEVNQQEEMVKSQRSNIICEVCEEEEAIVRCLECREYFCDFCHNAHKRSKKTRNHETASIEDLRSGKAPYQSRLWNEVPKCPNHSSQDLFFCETCETLICAVCTALDHKAPDHKFIDISAAVASCKEKVTEHITEAKQCINKFEEAKKKALNSKLDHNNMTVEMNDRITKNADDAVDKIRENERLLKEKVTKVCHKKDACFDQVLECCKENIEKAEKTLATVKSVMDQANNFDLLKLQPNLLQNLQDAADQETLAPVQGLTFEDLQQCEDISQTDLGFTPRMSVSVQEQARRLQVGTRVKRGPDWCYGNQDGQDEGRVICLDDADVGFVDVEWSSGLVESYRMGAKGHYDLQMVNFGPRMSVSVQEQARRLQVGTRVIRGPDWHYGNQDGQGEGRVICIDDADFGYVDVEWSSGLVESYRMGAKGHYDLQMVNFGPRMSVSVQEQARRLQVGTRVIRGPDWHYGNQDGRDEGRVICLDDADVGLVDVEWSSGLVDNYRMGAGGHYDLQMVKYADDEYY
ncbi:E3 ubiquitin-protein ligase TRIM56-like [Patiria miniata]|uniref:Uncharacterized protein n=1 Tax=Patiria miniata TaxID=46514 RepID=A0A913ZW62_PATMI|nr:E3 ubiquitin-protein ligase TRIM56-like [Patiria miniata]